MKQTVLSAAHIKTHHVISYADAFVVATAIQENGIVVTANPEFQSVETVVQVERLESSERISTHC